MARDDSGSMLLGGLIGAGMLYLYLRQRSANGGGTQPPPPPQCPEGQRWSDEMQQCIPALGGDVISLPNGAEIVWIGGGMGREPGNPLPSVQRWIALYDCQFTIQYLGPEMTVNIDLAVQGTRCTSRTTRTIGAASVPVRLTFYVGGQLWLCGEVGGNPYPVVMTMRDATTDQVILSKLLGEVVA